MPSAHAVRGVLAALIAVAAAGPLAAQGRPQAPARPSRCTVAVVPFTAGVSAASAVASRLTQAFERLAGPDGPVTWFSADTTRRPRDPTGRIVRAQALLTASVFVHQAPDSTMSTVVEWRVFSVARNEVMLHGRIERLRSFADSGIVDEIRREVRARLPEAARR